MEGFREIITLEQAAKYLSVCHPQVGTSGQSLSHYQQDG